MAAKIKDKGDTVIAAKCTLADWNEISSSLAWFCFQSWKLHIATFLYRLKRLMEESFGASGTPIYRVTCSLVDAIYVVMQGFLIPALVLLFALPVSSLESRVLFP